MMLWTFFKNHMFSLKHMQTPIVLLFFPIVLFCFAIFFWHQQNIEKCLKNVFNWVFGVSSTFFFLCFIFFTGRSKFFVFLIFTNLTQLWRLIFSVWRIEWKWYKNIINRKIMFIRNKLRNFRPKIFFRKWFFFQFKTWLFFFLEKKHLKNMYFLGTLKLRAL